MRLGSVNRNFGTEADIVTRHATAKRKPPLVAAASVHGDRHLAGGGGNPDPISNAWHIARFERQRANAGAALMETQFKHSLSSPPELRGGGGPESSPGSSSFRTILRMSASISFCMPCSSSCSA